MLELAGENCNLVNAFATREVGLNFECGIFSRMIEFVLELGCCLPSVSIMDHDLIIQLMKMS